MDELNLDALLPSDDEVFTDSKENIKEALAEMFAQSIVKYDLLADKEGHGHQDGNEGMIVLFEIVKHDGTIIADAIPIVYNNNEQAEEGLEKHREMMMAMVSSKGDGEEITGRISIINQYQH